MRTFEELPKGSRLIMTQDAIDNGLVGRATSPCGTFLGISKGGIIRVKRDGIKRPNLYHQRWWEIPGNLRNRRIVLTTADNDEDLILALQEFRAALPGWWYTLGSCSVSRDASCGPDRGGQDKHLLSDRLFDEGFHCDCDGTMADALRHVMKCALDAKNAAAKVEP